MCDSPVMPSALSFGVLSKYSLFGANYSRSVAKLDHLDELRGKPSSSEDGSPETSTTSNDSYLYRCKLEQDVHELQNQLCKEMELHAILDKAIEKQAIEISSPSCLAPHAQELLSNIATLEDAVSRLEEETVSLYFQLSQERNERRLAEYRFKRLSPQLTRLFSSDSIQALDDVNLVAFSHQRKVSSIDEMETCLAAELRLPRGLPPNGPWEHPNLLSEEMVRCMRNIFISLADSSTAAKPSSQEIKSSSLSPRGHMFSSSWWSSERLMISSWLQSPLVNIQNNSEVLASEDVHDPYKVRGKLSWADIGSYGSATEVSWMSAGKQRLDYAAGALREFRTLVEQLAKVNPTKLSSDEKLAFWINLYNALIMHAYLAYGVPRSDLKLFSLLQKAAYTVGGHSYTAAVIEYVILKMKPPLHRPQIALLLALHKLKVSEDQRKSAIDAYDPLLTFALSCGMYSSPAVRIYTPKNVQEELQEAQRDFIRASVGVSSKGKLLVPKLLHCFAKSFVDDANLAVWISHYLPPHQAAFVEKCISQRRQSLLMSRNCGILTFDSRFRYLFLPDCITK